jgi:diguanylate cyclase (GGDEF)-like protein/PAS domain S-box-containing protein
MSERKIQHGKTGEWKDKLRNQARETMTHYDDTCEYDTVNVHEVIEDLRLHQIELEMQNSELMDAHARLEASRLKYFHLFDLAPIGYMVLDMKGSFHDINLAAAEMLGQNRKNLTGANPGLLAFLSQDSLSVFKNHISAVCSGISPQKCTLKIKRFNSKEQITVRISSNRFRADDNKSELIFSSLTDISELVVAQEAVQSSERRFRELFEQQNTGVALFAQRQEGNGFVVGDINPAGCYLCKRSKHEIVGLTIDEAFPGFAETGLMQKIRQVWSSAKPDSVKELYYNDDFCSYWADYHFFKLPSGEIVAIFEDVSKRREVDRVVETSREWYRTIAEDIPALVCRLTPAENYTFANNAYCEMFGLKRDSIVGLNHHIAIPPEFRASVSSKLKELTPENPIVTNEHYNLSQDNSLRWLRWTNRAMFDRDGNLSEYICIGEDITDQKSAFENLKESEMLKSSIIEAIPDIIIRYSKEGRYLDIFTQDEGKLAQPLNLLLNRSVEDVLPEDVAQKIKKSIKMALNSDCVCSLDYSLNTPSGEITFEARFRACGENTVIALIRDITEARAVETQLKFMSMHDQLTGIYNRNYFEAELKRYEGSRDYPVTIISADVDGLKLVNDTIGHSRGDTLLVTAAHIIRDNLRTSDILARIGGDEFATLLPRTDAKTGEAIVARINENITAYNNSHEDLPLSLSIGVATAENKEVKLNDLLTNADDLMYRDKLYRSPSTRSQVVQTLLVALAERDFITEGHTRRLAELCTEIGKRANLTNSQLSDLYLLTQVHDLGKVGVPDSILFKEGPLTEKEWEIMRLHPEKGYRIAISSPDLSGVSDMILKHHERYDGSGYPLGLEGDKIPIECRILSIVDAFDAMTNKRPYNKVKSCEEAVEEIKRYSGYQFDPELVAIFLDIINC